MNCRVNLASDPISLTILAANGEEHRQLETTGHDGLIAVALLADSGQIGKAAYNAYCAHRGWKSVRGEPLPAWENAEPDIRMGWDMAALAVAGEISQTMVGVITRQGK